MSYGSTFVQFEANGRISQKFSRPHMRKENIHERSHKDGHYGKQFDINLSRVDNNPVDKASVKESMLSYSKKMRSIQDARYSSGNTKGESLFVRAKHIPKYPARAPKKRRPMSFDELLGRDRDSAKETVGKPRPKSDKTKPLGDNEKSADELHLPLLSERLRKSGSNVQVSLVSASDLYEIVDISLRSKGTRHESLQMLRMEADDKHHSEAAHAYQRLFPEDSYNKYERNTVNSQTKSRRPQRINESTKQYECNFDDSIVNVPSVEFYDEIFALDKSDLSERKNGQVKLPSLNNEPFRRRPQRAKRMKLIDPGLSVIPEDNVMETRNSVSDHRKDVMGITSPPPPKTPSKPQENLTKTALDAIEENVEKVSFKDNGLTSEAKQTNMGVEISPRTPDTVEIRREYRSYFPFIDDSKSTKKVIKDDGDVRIEVTQCPPKHDILLGAKLKAQKRFSKKLIFLRDTPR